MDLTDDQWALMAPLLPSPPRRPQGRGRPNRAADDRCPSAESEEVQDPGWVCLVPLQTALEGGVPLCLAGQLSLTGGALRVPYEQLLGLVHVA